VQEHPSTKEARRRRFDWLGVACLAMFALPMACRAATISFRVDRGSEAVEIEASAVLRADASTAWRVLTDYGRYADFIPDVRASRVISRSAGEVIVEQVADASLWALHAPVEVVYRIDEEPPTRIRSHASAAGIPALDSVYALTVTGDGVRLDYRGRMAPMAGLAVPSDAGARSVERGFRALAEEIERVARQR
jgi:hypothetical protein